MRATSLGAVLGTLALVLSGCGSNGASSTSGATGASSGAQGSSLAASGGSSSGASSGVTSSASSGATSGIASSTAAATTAAGSTGGTGTGGSGGSIGGSSGMIGSDSALEAACVDGGLICGTLNPVTIAGGPDSGILPIIDTGQVKGQAALDYFCYPGQDAGVAPIGELFIHLVGTGSDPAIDHQFELQACLEGFAAIGPMYENQDQVTGTCDTLGSNQDACYTEVHEAVIYGHSYPIDAGLTPVSYTPADSLVHRTASLLGYLATAYASFPAWATYSHDFTSGDSSKIVLAGHSQGSGHSLYWSHNLAPSREIMLSGPPDRLHTPSATSTPTWIVNFSADAGISPDQIYGFNNVNDGTVDFAWAMGNDDALGLAAETCNYDQSIPSTCHRVIIDAGCSSSASDYAHASTEVLEFGPAPTCERGLAGHDNLGAWTYLLGVDAGN